MIYKVQGPDGRIHRFEGPDGASPEDVLSAAQKQFGEQPKKPSAYQQRESAAQKVAEDVVEGRISPVSGVLQGVGQAAGLVGDIGGNIAQRAISGAEVMFPNAAKIVKNISSPIARELQPAVSAISDVYGSVKQKYPETVGNIEAIGNISMIAPAVPAIGKMAGRVAEGITDFSAIDRAISPPKPVAIKRPEARDWYARVRELGVKFSPEESLNLEFELKKLKPKDPAEAAVWEKSGIQKNVDMITGAMKQEPLSFSGAQALRADLNSELKMAYNSGDKTRAMQLEKVKDALTSAMMNPKAPGAKGIEAKNAWQMANHEFQIETILDELDLIAAKAAGKAQPANSLDTAINNYLNNKKLSAGLRPEERAALKAVTEKTQAGELLKSAASRIAPLAAGAVGGPPGFLIGHYGSQLSRTAAETIKLRKLQEAYDLINRRPPPSQIGPWGGGMLLDKKNRSK